MSKILIVEGNAESRYMLEQVLTSRGHHVIAAENGEDALRLARQDPPDVIISDIMMPVMNGFRLCHEVKNDASLRNIPFIFYTATFVDKADEKLAMSLGASRSIVKPTEGEQFIQILDEVLGEHRQGILHVPEGPLEGEDTILEMYDNSIARKLAETVEKLQNERRALIKSEQRLKEAQELAQIGHWEFDVKSNSLECSDEIYCILGLKPQEFDVSYEAFTAFVHPDDRDYVAKARKESLEKKTPYDMEYRVLLKDGTIKYVYERFQTIYDDDGMSTYSMGTVQDITDRKQAEEKLHHLNLVLRAIREVNQLIVKEKDRDALIHKTCEILIKTRGYYNAWIVLLDEEDNYITSAEAGLGKDFAPMKQLLKQGQWPACVKKVLSKKELIITEESKTECTGCPLSAKYAGRGAYTIWLVHNERNYGLLSVSNPQLSIWDKKEHGLIREAAGDIAFALYSIEVEEKRKQAEEALRESEKKYRDLFENSTDFVYTLDLQGNFTDVNRAAEDLTGYTKNELIGMNFKDYTPDTTHERIFEAFNSIFNEAKPVKDFPLEVVIKDGTKKYFETCVSPLKKEGGIIGFQGSSRDITERKRGEVKLRVSETRFRELFDNMSSGVAVYEAVDDGRDFVFKDFNKAGERIENIRRDETIGRRVTEVFPGVRDFGLLDVFRRVWKMNAPEHFPVKFYRDNRIQSWRENFVYKLPSGEVVAIYDDVTERREAGEALREANDIINKSSSVAFTWKNQEGWPVEFVSENVKRLFGYTAEEFTTGEVDYADCIHPKDLERMAKEVAEFSSKAETTEFTHTPYRILTKDGSEKIISDWTYIVRDDEGRITHYKGIVEDITERKRAEEALRASENKYRTLLENLPQKIFFKDPDLVYVSCNENFAWDLKIKPEEMTGKTDYEFFPRKLAEKYRADDKRAISSGKTEDIEEKYIQDGQERWVQTLKTPIKDEKGNITGVLGIFWDITERKEAEKKIKEYADNLESMVKERTKELNRALYDTEEARDKIDGILKSVGDGLIVTDIHNRVILMNRAAEDLLGIRLSEVIERPVDFAIEDQTLRDRIKATLDKRESDYQFDFELPGDNRTHPRIIRARTSIIENKSGTQTGIITTMHDVTYEREVDRMKTEFISTAAHELRTPLTSILGFSEVLLNQNNIPAEEKTEFLGYINTQSKALSKIIDDLLDISRIESGRGFSINKEPCNPLEITKKVISYHKKQSPKHQFEVMFPKRPVKIIADIDKIGQVVKNLIDNAVKYSPDGGTIKVRGKIAGDQYQISVEDQGIGMTQEQVEKIFDKFYRAKDACFISKGTGLGMSIVKHIVESHGGNVWVDSEHGKGTTVHFAVPIGEEIGK